MPRHVRKGDSVVVTAGNFRGAVGEIVRVDGDNERVFVKFPNSVYDGVKRKPLIKTLKPTRVNPQGGQVALDRGFHISNVSPAVDGKPSPSASPSRTAAARPASPSRAARNSPSSAAPDPREEGLTHPFTIPAAPARRRATRQRPKRASAMAKTKGTHKGAEHEADTGPAAPRLREHYKNTVRSAVMKEFGIDNPMAARGGRSSSTSTWVATSTASNSRPRACRCSTPSR